MEDVMTYEEKLQKVVSKLHDERDLTRKGHKTKVTLDDDSFTKISIIDVCKILLKLQDDEKALNISDAYYLSDIYDRGSYEKVENEEMQPENVEIIVIELDEMFDAWYDKHLILQKSTLSELAYINLLRILEIALNIKEKAQLNQLSTVIIPILPQRIRFHELMLTDDVGMRDEFIEGRLDSLKYLKQVGAIFEFKHINSMMHRWDDTIKVTINPSIFYDFLEKTKEEVSRRLAKHEENNTGINNEDEKAPIENIYQSNSNITIWPKDFLWEGKDFIFGKYGPIHFNSQDRRHIFKILTDKKGCWATVSELKNGKDASYVRSTIKQIEDRIPEKARKVVSIISTQDDDSEEKPKVGAYRIKILS